MPFAKLVVVDGRGHMLGRMASIVAKELLSGQKVVCSWSLWLNGCPAGVRPPPALSGAGLGWPSRTPGLTLLLGVLAGQVITRAEETNISGSFFRNKCTWPNGGVGCVSWVMLSEPFAPWRRVELVFVVFVRA